MQMKKIYRILDANLNRAREGLRVVEEVARFYLEDERLSKSIKSTRHRITKIAKESFEEEKLLLHRDSQGDVGARGMGKTERKRDKLKSIVEANLKRSEEALRALEEFGKLINEESGEKFKRVRFKIYELEKEIVQRI
ncbi:MAG: hypothetical protein AMJ90_04150 [candidate division Zixibacteria bacterium SM23_73_2]|nr:MAG: hypothetical protein AMJ90_04150 [candidate division Zixibacteria bacterium SM23_73_2]